MPIIYQTDDGIWYKKKTKEEQDYKNLVDIAIDHALGNNFQHSMDQIKGSFELGGQIQSINRELSEIKKEIKTNSGEIETIKKANSKISKLESKLFYNAWFFKNSYKHLEFDLFENDSKLFYGVIENEKLVPESDKHSNYSIYRTIKIIPKLESSISRYMMHIEYDISEGGGLIAEISFDDGNMYHTVLSTVQDNSFSSYYQFPDFCDCDNNVPEPDAASFMVRFRLLSNELCQGVYVSSYGIMVA